MNGRTPSRLRFPRAIAAAVARTTLHLFSEGKAKCGFLLFLSSSEISGIGQLEAFNQINVGVHSATRPDDQGRQLVLLSSSSKILYFSGELPAAHACRVPGWKSSSRSHLDSAFAADLAASDVVAHATDANCFAGSCFLPAETRWPWWATFFYLEIPNHEAERRDTNS